MDENVKESIEAKHSKEKKELQAQIQSLKKAAKNDKSKKKEVMYEILKLETELENRHKNELEEASTQLCQDSNPISEVEQALTKVKISKAQKRRDKKQQQEREREEQIKLQEEENVNGPRNLELETIANKLNKRGLQTYPIQSDGDCLFKAVSHQLETVRGQLCSIEKLRNDVASYIKRNKDDFLPFMSNPETCEMLSDVEFEEYCHNLCTTKVWGGQLEIRALSSCLKCPIIVIQATGPESIDQGSEFNGPPVVISYHRHLYKLGEHYNSTQPLNTESNDL